MNFSSAEAWCAERGTHLASIHGKAEAQRAYKTCAATAGNGECWIGLQCIDKDQYDYEWMDGTDWDYTYWNSGEPNNWNDQEDCVHTIDSTGYWNDIDCSVDGSFKPLCNAPSGILIVQYVIHLQVFLFRSYCHNAISSFV